MSKDPKPEEVKEAKPEDAKESKEEEAKEAETKVDAEAAEAVESAIKEAASILENIPGVGPKTAEKLAILGYDTIQKIADADKEDLAQAVAGLSVSKSEGVIDEAKALLEAIASGAVDITGKAKKSKRKKAPEPDPELHELPPAEEIEEVVQRTNLETGLEKEKVALGINFGPKWLSRFERARIVGARALQISMGAPILVDMKSAPMELFALAEAELRSGILPMTIRRSLPTGETHDIPLAVLLKHTRLD